MENINLIFQEKGYYIFPKIFSKHEIDPLISELHKIREKRYKPNFSSQATHRIIPFSFNEYGYLSESILGFTRQWNIPKLARAGRQILLGLKMKKILNKVFPQFKDFVQQNNMLFDKSMETIDHIDSWYLDTHPKGYLVGAWVALEDIHPHSGPFRVYPGSHKKIDPYRLQNLNHNDFIEEISNIKKGFKAKELVLKKGDLVIWDSRLIHGASKVKDASFSRKSLTSHYYPINCCVQSKKIYARQNIFYIILRKIYQHPELSKGYFIYQLNGKFVSLSENIKLFFASLKQIMLRKQPKISYDMRSKSYEKSLR